MTRKGETEIDRLHWFQVYTVSCRTCLHCLRNEYHLVIGNEYHLVIGSLFAGKGSVCLVGKGKCV